MDWFGSKKQADIENPKEEVKMTSESYAQTGVVYADDILVNPEVVPVRTEERIGFADRVVTLHVLRTSGLIRKEASTWRRTTTHTMCTSTTTAAAGG